MRHRTIPHAFAFVLLAALLPAEGFPGQHSLCIQSAPEFMLAMSPGGPALGELGLRSEIDSRFALFGPCFADLSFGSYLAAPSAYSADGLRYRGFASAFASAALGLRLPWFSQAASMELGASFHEASWTGTKLMFAFTEIQGAFRVIDPSPRPFYAFLGRAPSGYGALRAELSLPFSLQLRSGAWSLGLGIGLGLRRDSYERIPAEAARAP